MIKVKAPISGWHEVTREQAKEFVKHKIKDITTKVGQDRIDHINNNLIQGITVEELMEDK